MSDWITLNIGGKCFLTTRTTLCSRETDSVFCKIFSSTSDVHWNSKQDENGSYLFDRSYHYFEPVLNYLRHGQLIVDDGVSLEGVLEEAKFYNIQSLVELLEQRLRERERPSADVLTRRNVIDILTRSHVVKDELRFQGVNLSQADLSGLDLRFINFKQANLSDCDLSHANLSFSNLERANLSHAKLDSAQLIGARLACATLEGASMQGCNFEDPSGSKVSMEGANLKNAILENSQMSGVNLRVAKLKGANLRHCDLRGACLAGADLESCDFTASDLQAVNLRGANVKSTVFESMTTPLHMSQTI